MDAFWQNVWVKDLLIPTAVFFLFFTVSVPLLRLVFGLLQKGARRSGKSWNEKLEYGFRKPLRLVLAATGLFVALSVCPFVWGNAAARNVIIRCFRSFLVIAATWGFCRMAGCVELNKSAFAKKLDLQIDQTLMPVVSGVMRFLLIALAVLIVAQEWDFSISGLLAGLGLGGLAFALAAKDMLANLFGGLVILLDHPFSIGDWIRAGDVEGTVENISFRSLKVRTFDRAVVTVPNSMVAGAPIYNYSRMGGKRRIEFPLTLEYGYPPERLEACAAQIRALLKRDGTVESGSAIVALDSLGDSGPVYKVICCTNQTDYGDFLLERGRLYGEILRILEKEKINLAYPTSAVLVKKQTPPGKGGASV